MSNCIGFGSDGASAMIGEHESVWSRVRAEAPGCQLNRCIYHSLALCIEKASRNCPMDADPEEMVQELTLHQKSLQDRLFDRQGERLAIDKVDLGAKFTHELNSYADASSGESTAK
eukprot:gene10088-18740_t